MRSLILFTFFLDILSSAHAQIDTSYFPNGNIDSIVNISENSLIHYYPNGQIKGYDFLIFKNQKDYEKRKKWYPNGKLKYQVQLSDTSNAQIDCQYYENGNLMQQDYSRLVLIDSDTTYEFCFGQSWCENGTLTSANIWMSSDEIQPFVHHHCNGQISLKSRWCKHRLVGDFFEFYDNSKIQVEGKYKDFSSGSEIKDWEPGVSKEFKVGVWKFYTPDGKLDHTEEFDANHNLKIK